MKTPGRRFLCAPTSAENSCRSGCGDASPLARSSHREGLTGSSQDRAERASLAISDINRCRDWGPENPDPRYKMPRATVPTTAKRSGSVACSAVRHLRSSLSVWTIGRDAGGNTGRVCRETAPVPTCRSADGIASGGVVMRRSALAGSRTAGCRASWPCRPGCRRCRSRGTPRRRSAGRRAAGRCA